MKPDGQSPSAERAGLPTHPFLYTLDQVASIMSISLPKFKSMYVYYEGRTTARRSIRTVSAVNIAPDNEAPEWRISEVEVIRWMKACGFRVFRNPTRL